MRARAERTAVTRMLLLIAPALHAALCGGGVAGASSASSTWHTLHVDEHLLVVDKGAGLLTVPGVGPEKADCLLSRVRTAGFTDIANAAHRLDRDTSGIVALGRTAAAHKRLSQQFQDRQVGKKYEALVLGWPADEEGAVDQAIGKVRAPGEAFARMRIAPSGSADGRPSRTRWRVLERHDDGIRWSRVELMPLTGRAHQLRLHMEFIGHPILGDELHGSAESRGGATRLCLHAAALEFRHPASGSPMRIESKAPF